MIGLLDYITGTYTLFLTSIYHYYVCYLYRLRVSFRCSILSFFSVRFGSCYLTTHIYVHTHENWVPLVSSVSKHLFFLLVISVCVNNNLRLTFLAGNVKSASSTHTSGCWLSYMTATHTHTWGDTLLYVSHSSLLYIQSSCSLLDLRATSFHIFLNVSPLIIVLGNMRRNTPSPRI